MKEEGENRDVMEKKFLKSWKFGRDCNKAKKPHFQTCCLLKIIYLKEELNKITGERKEKRKKERKPKNKKKVMDLQKKRIKEAVKICKDKM